MGHQQLNFTIYDLLYILNLHRHVQIYSLFIGFPYQQIETMGYVHGNTCRISRLDY